MSKNWVAFCDLHTNNKWNPKAVGVRCKSPKRKNRRNCVPLIKCVNDAEEMKCFRDSRPIRTSKLDPRRCHSSSVSVSPARRVSPVKSCRSVRSPSRTTSTNTHKSKTRLSRDRSASAFWCRNGGGDMGAGNDYDGQDGIRVPQKGASHVMTHMRDNCAACNDCLSKWRHSIKREFKAKLTTPQESRKERRGKRVDPRWRKSFRPNSRLRPSRGDLKWLLDQRQQLNRGSSSCGRLNRRKRSPRVSYWYGGGGCDEHSSDESEESDHTESDKCMMPCNIRKQSSRPITTILSDETPSSWTTILDDDEEGSTRGRLKRGFWRSGHRTKYNDSIPSKKGTQFEDDDYKASSRNGIKNGLIRSGHRTDYEDIIIPSKKETKCVSTNRPTERDYHARSTLRERPRRHQYLEQGRLEKINDGHDNNRAWLREQSKSKPCPTGSPCGRTPNSRSPDEWIPQNSSRKQHTNRQDVCRDDSTFDLDDIAPGSRHKHKEPDRKCYESEERGRAGRRPPSCCPRYPECRPFCPSEAVMMSRTPKTREEWVDRHTSLMMECDSEKFATAKERTRRLVNKSKELKECMSSMNLDFGDLDERLDKVHMLQNRFNQRTNEVLDVIKRRDRDSEDDDLPKSREISEDRTRHRHRSNLDSHPSHRTSTSKRSPWTRSSFRFGDGKLYRCLCEETEGGD